MSWRATYATRRTQYLAAQAAYQTANLAYETGKVTNGWVLAAPPIESLPAVQLLIAQRDAVKARRDRRQARRAAFTDALGQVSLLTVDRAEFDADLGEFLNGGPVTAGIFATFMGEPVALTVSLDFNDLAEFAKGLAEEMIANVQALR